MLQAITADIFDPQYDGTKMARKQDILVEFLVFPK